MPFFKKPKAPEPVASEVVTSADVAPVEAEAAPLEPAPVELAPSNVGPFDDAPMPEPEPVHEDLLAAPEVTPSSLPVFTAAATGSIVVPTDVDVISTPEGWTKIEPSEIPQGTVPQNTVLEAFYKFAAPEPPPTVNLAHVLEVIDGYETKLNAGQSLGLGDLRAIKKSVQDLI